MAHSKAPTLGALRAFEEARAAGVPLAEAQALLIPAPKPKRHRETWDHLGMLKRNLKAAGKRAADGDEPELMDLLAIQADWEAAVAVGIRGQLDRGMSWAYIAQGLGVKRQTAHERWAPKVKALGGQDHG